MGFRSRHGEKVTMIEEAQAADVSAVETDTRHSTEQDDTLSAEDLIAQYAHAGEEEGEPTDGESHADPDVQVAGLDLDNLDEDSWQEIADHLNSRGADRIAGLIKDRKSLQGKLDAKSDREENPLEETPKAENNPFQQLETVEDLKGKNTEVEEMIEWAEDLLDDNDEEHRESVIYEEDGKEYSKGEVRKLLRGAKKARDSHLPARLKQLQTEDFEEGQRQQLTQQRVQARKLAESEFTWMTEEGNESRERYEKVLATPAMQMVAEQDPSLPYILAHAADSIRRSEARREGIADGKVEKKLESLATSRMRPPGNPAANNAAPAKAGKGPGRMLQELRNEYGQTGDHKVLTEILTLESEI